MKTKILRTIKKYNMLSAGDTVAVALSGGADSMTLFHFLCTNRAELGINVIALHVNHGLREESKQEEIFVKDFCEKMGVQCIVLHAEMNDSEKPQGLSTETWARDLRYKFFFEQCEKYTAKLATAHTLSDKTETVIFNLTRGSGLKGAIGIPAIRDNIIRPLIDCTREEIEQYCTDNSLKYVTDKSNFDDVYSRNKIRLNVIPVLKQINPSAQKSIAHFSQESGEIYTFLTQLSDNLYDKSLLQNGFDINILNSAHTVIVKNFLRNYLDKIGCLSGNNIEDILAGLKMPHFSKQLSVDVVCNVNDGVLSFDKPNVRPIENCETAEVFLDKSTVFLNKTYGFSVVSYKEYLQIKKSDKNTLTYYVDYDKIKGILKLRTRRVGDSFTLVKRNVTKTVKKLLIEDKIPVEKRDFIAVLTDDTEKVIWLEGYGTNKSYAPVAERKSILVITQKEN